MHRSKSRALVYGALPILTGILVPALVSAESGPLYEAPPVQSAAKILPPQLLASPNAKVQNAVTSDGFLNTYVIESPWGSLKAVSTAQLRQFVPELDAVARLDALSGTKEFSGAIAGVAGGVVKGTTSLLTAPVATVSGALSGVGAAFGRANEAMSNMSKGAEEGGTVSQLSGYAKVKRDYAYEFGVDVYSRNPILQEHLESVTKAGFAGNITARAALVAVPGAAGAALALTHNAEGLNELFRDLPPLELRKRSRANLQAMAVDPDVADLLIANTVFTVREQTLLVEALSAMTNTNHREIFVKHAVLTRDDDMALFRSRQAQMYEAYNRKKPLAQFVAVGDVAVGQRADGTLVFCAPLDQLFWTQALANFADTFKANLSKMPPVTAKELVLTGTLSQRARAQLQADGWKIFERTEKALLGS